MGNTKASSVAPLPAEKPSGLAKPVPEQARDFHFAVTWVTLFLHLDPVLSTGPRPRIETSSSTRALVPVVAPAPFQDSNAAWEMVVPKMIRTSARTFIPETKELV
jgi:hypothetical protein